METSGVEDKSDARLEISIVVAIAPTAAVIGALTGRAAPDEYECHRDAQAARSSVAMPPSAVALYEKCMTAKGYAPRP